MSNTTHPIIEALPPLFGSIPPDLRALPNWVVFRIEDVIDKETGRPKIDEETGQTTKTKVPYRTSGSKAASVRPEEWTTFDQAVKASPRFDGIGFMFGDSGFAGIDIDHCVGADGLIENWARVVIDSFASYSEISISGTGVHIIVRGQVEGGRKYGNFEAYSHARYFTMSGRCVPGTPPTIEARQDELTAFVERVFPKRMKAGEGPKRTASLPTNLSDAELLGKAHAAKNGDAFSRLWNGGTGDHGGDHSRADMALACHLAFWWGGDAGAMDRMFRQSGLMRDKWDRQDYQEQTVSKALAVTIEHYTPRGAAIIQNGLRAASAANHRNGSRNGSHPEGGAGEAAGQDPARPAQDQAAQDQAAQALALTDIGNGQRLAARHGGDLRFCHAWEKWLIWDGQRWQKDDTGEIDRRAKETAQHIYQEAADCPDTARQTELAKHALRSQSHARLQSMIALANSEPGIPARAAEWDKQPWLLAAGNGTVDLKMGCLQDSRRADMGTKRAGTHYDPEATAPRWEAFLATVLPDVETRAFFQRAAGYALTGDVSEQCLFFLYGSGSNGKSTALRALMDTLGDYALQAAPDLLIAREGAAGGPNNDVAELQGTRLVVTIEVEDGKRMAEGLVKQITGGDIIKARFMRQDFFQFEPTHKIFLAANHKPAIRGQDVAIWRRIKMVPFDVQIADADKDPHLADKLRAEMPGILAWAVRGCLDWQRQGLAAPSAVLEATAAYQAGEDVLGDFLGECCLLRPALRVTAAALYTAYVKWAEENSERSLSKKNFGGRLQEGRRIFPAINIGPKHARGWEGIGLVDTLSTAIYDSVEDEKIDKIDKSDP